MSIHRISEASSRSLSYLPTKCKPADEAANMPELIKSQRHYLAKKRRQHYNEQCAIAKDNVIDDKPRVMHYSFDYVQQVYYQFNAKQPGSIFFKTVTARNVASLVCHVRPLPPR